MQQWNSLTNVQKEMAKAQYIYIRAVEDEITEEQANRLYDTSDSFMRCLTGYVVNKDDTVDVVI